jgi:hypothetical protein
MLPIVRGIGSLTFKSGLVWLLWSAAAASAGLQDSGVRLSVPLWASNQVQLALSCESGVSYVIETSLDLQTWTPVLTNSDYNIARTFWLDAPANMDFYRARRGPLPLFASAMAAVETIDFNGNNFASDSFDSADLAYSTNGLYSTNADMIKANGDVLSNSTITNSFPFGDAIIKGRIRSGPSGTITIGTNSSVGDRAWVEGGNVGIEAGHSANDMNVSFPDVTLPTTTWLPATHTFGNGANARVNGQVYDYIILNGGNYSIPGDVSTNGIYIGTNASVWLLVNGSVNLSGQCRIHVSYGASLRVFMNAASFTLGGQGVINENGNASSFYYFGMRWNTNLVAGANANFVGTIYAPEADFSIGGGDSGIYDFIGASVTKSVSLNGKFRFHFDENLERNGMVR